MVEYAIPAASTGTTAPSNPLQRSGVITIAPRVVAVVIKTDKATLPLAMYVQRLDACPPLMLPTKTIPAVNAGERLKARLRPSANRGIMP